MRPIIFLTAGMALVAARPILLSTTETTIATAVVVVAAAPVATSTTVLNSIARRAALDPEVTASDAARSTVAFKDYLAIFRDSVGTPDQAVHALASRLRTYNAKINYEYNTVIKGLAFSISPDLIPTVKELSDERWPFILEEDQVVSIS